MLSTGEGPGLDHRLEDAGLDRKRAIMLILTGSLDFGKPNAFMGRPRGG